MYKQGFDKKGVFYVYLSELYCFETCKTRGALTETYFRIEIRDILSKHGHRFTISMISIIWDEGVIQDTSKLCMNYILDIAFIILYGHVLSTVTRVSSLVFWEMKLHL